MVQVCNALLPADLLTLPAGRAVAAKKARPVWQFKLLRDLAGQQLGLVVAPFAQAGLMQRDGSYRGWMQAGLADLLDQQGSQGSCEVWRVAELEAQQSLAQGALVIGKAVNIRSWNFRAKQRINLEWFCSFPGSDGQLGQALAANPGKTWDRLADMPAKSARLWENHIQA